MFLSALLDSQFARSFESVFYQSPQAALQQHFPDEEQHPQDLRWWLPQTALGRFLQGVNYLTACPKYDHQSGYVFW